ncbi:MAG: type II toxin-antitoxin system antitoxin [Candidatus Krumholzibacteriia bacterium]
MAVEKKTFLLRLPADLHDDLRRWADAELRSLNGQIEFVLRRAVRERQGGAGPAPPAGPIDRLPDN